MFSQCFETFVCNFFNKNYLKDNREEEVTLNANS